MSSMVEKVARAIINAHFGEDCWDSLTEEVYDDFLRTARAAIEAMREPTEHMLKAGDLPGWDDSVTIGLSSEVWQAMITAALEDK